MFAALRSLGALGLFLLSAGDSSFVFLPFGNDLLLISLVAAKPTVGYAALCVLAATAGSLIGVTSIDVVMRKVGEEGLEHFVKPKTVARLKAKLEKRGGLMVFAGTLAPPPFPFTAVVMTASALQTPRWIVLTAVGLGRLIQFAIEAWLAMRYGERIVGWLDSPVVEYAVWAFVAVAIVGTALSVRKWLGGRRELSRRPA